MSLAVAIPCGIAAAVAYGGATAVQHSAAHTGTGEADAVGLLRLLTSPRWWLSVAGDGVGLLLQVVALATGPVVLIQPLLVLALPVSLIVGFLIGRPRPSASDPRRRVRLRGRRFLRDGWRHDQHGVSDVRRQLVEWVRPSRGAGSADRGVGAGRLGFYPHPDLVPDRCSWGELPRE